jgi:Histone methylation protein DOT1
MFSVITSPDFSSAVDALQHLIVQLENDISLVKPNRLRERLDALDRLDAHLAGLAEGETGFERELFFRATTIRERLEAVNAGLCDAIRHQIQCGSLPHEFLRWTNRSSFQESSIASANAMAYDFLDELISGVFRFEEPECVQSPRDPEQLFYQPTPARHIFNLIELIALAPDDVFIDLGSGLGHVAMMVSICTRSRSIGIELEAAYVERAQECARELNLSRVTFIQQDARAADLSAGTVFYLYTPFVGSILSAVLNNLRGEAAKRQIRVCCYGPCTRLVAEESWLAPIALSDDNSIAVFCSRA